MIIFCKTTEKDFLRLMVTIDSIQKYNKDNLKFYIAVDEKDIRELDVSDIEADIEIVSERDIVNLSQVKMGDWKKQQVIKFEFCKNMDSDNCLILDSDSYFIKDFQKKDFFDNGGNLYTVIHRVDKLIDDYKYVGEIPEKNIEFYKSLRERIKNNFRNHGNLYDFGPPPVLWSKEVVLYWLTEPPAPPLKVPTSILEVYWGWIYDVCAGRCLFLSSMCCFITTPVFNAVRAGT